MTTINETLKINAEYHKQLDDINLKLCEKQNINEKLNLLKILIEQYEHKYYESINRVEEGTLIILRGILLDLMLYKRELECESEPDSCGNRSILSYFNPKNELSKSHFS